MTNQTKHTPGPWTLDEVWMLVMGPNQEEVCAIHAGVPDHNRTQLNREIPQNNARLIAAAPELLEALKECFTCDGATAERSHTYAMQRLAAINEIAKAAIAKAEVKS